MALASTFEKTRKDIEKALVDSGALQAAVGAGDLAVKKLREARTELGDLAATIDSKVLRERVDAVQASVVGRLGTLQADAKAAPDQVKDLPTRAQAVLGEAVTFALTTYGDLAERGQDLVARVRGQQANANLKDQASTTAAHARATRTTAKKSAAKTASTTKSAAQRSASTAKRSAAGTKTSTKATTTSAKKTASAAKKATGSTASKVGR
jgi:heparin binding hemagglutinin HbhA